MIKRGTLKGPRFFCNLSGLGNPACASWYTESQFFSQGGEHA